MAQPDQPSQSEKPPEKKRLSKLAVAACVLAALPFLCYNVYVFLLFQRIWGDWCLTREGDELVLILAGALSFLAAGVSVVVASIRLGVKRRSLRGWGIVGLASVFLVVDLFWPSFLRIPHGSSKQSEARSHLKAAFTALKQNSGDGKTFSVHLADAGLTLEPNRRYAYFYRDDVVQPDRPGHGPYSRKDFPPALVKYLEECKDREFVAFAIGNIDSDPALDVWAIDNYNNLVNVYDDRCDEPWTGENPCVKHPGK